MVGGREEEEEGEEWEGEEEGKRIDESGGREYFFVINIIRNFLRKEMMDMIEWRMKEMIDFKIKKGKCDVSK